MRFDDIEGAKVTTCTPSTKRQQDRKGVFTTAGAGDLLAQYRLAGEQTGKIRVDFSENSLYN